MTKIGDGQAEATNTDDEGERESWRRRGRGKGWREAGKERAKAWAGTLS